jgi:transposase
MYVWRRASRQIIPCGRSANWLTRRCWNCPAFDRVYAREGRPSIPPERLLRALLLQAFYTVRSERQLMEQLDYNLLFRWFVGFSADDPVWDATVFCKNRDRLLDGDVAAKFFASVLNLSQVCSLLSSEHFSVDGTLIEAWRTATRSSSTRD